MKLYVFIAIAVFILTHCGFCKASECIPRKYNHDSVVCVCNKTYCDKVRRPHNLRKNEYIMYTSSQSGQRFQMEQGHFHETKMGNIFVNKITVDVHKTFQTIIGWGATLTDAAGININSLPEPVRNLLMKSYFGEEGIEYNLARVPIGGTDFSTKRYTYNDKHDPGLNHFSLAQEDHDLQISMIKKATSLCPNETVQLLASAWLAPEWMKHNGTFTRPNQLKKNMYQTWADYHINFLKAYKKEGINFWGITTGNEPVDGILSSSVDGLAWLPQELCYWIVDNFGPTLRKSEFSSIKIISPDAKVIAYPFFVDKMVETDRSVLKFVDGFGLHWQLNSLISYPFLSLTHRKYPHKFILGTEACARAMTNFGSDVDLGNWQRGELYAFDIIRDLHQWVEGWMDCNLALDLNGGPNYLKNFADAPIIVNVAAAEFYKQPTYYALGHFSKFIPRNSIRIEVTQSVGNLDAVAFQKPNGEIVLVLLNTSFIGAIVNIVNKYGKTIRKSIPAKSITTIVYQ